MKENNIDVIDIEASGLSSEAYPIEVGVVLASGETYHRLIRPMDDWNYWDSDAQGIHGIRRALLFEQGASIWQVCRELNHFCNRRVFYSDGWSYDSAWLNKLFGYAGVYQSFRLSPIESLIGQSWCARQWQGVKNRSHVRHSLKRHRAMNDALMIAEAYRCYSLPAC